MSVIYETLGTSSNMAIRVEADVTEFYLDETRFGRKINIYIHEIAVNVNIFVFRIC
jgi:hypothetical protein